MNSNRPYLVRALYEWIVDNSCTPYLLVDATAEHARLPDEYVENGKIVLNVSPAAVRGLSLGNEEVTFNARFGGQPMDVLVPVQAILAVYARENGRGMLFNDDEGATPPPSGRTRGRAPRKPSLKVVK